MVMLNIQISNEISPVIVITTEYERILYESWCVLLLYIYSILYYNNICMHMHACARTCMVMLNIAHFK